MTYDTKRGAALVEAANEAMEGVTPGEWAFHRHDEESQWFGNIVGTYGVNDRGIQEIRTITCQLKYGPPEENEANAQFIAYARQGVPALAADHKLAIAEIERLREEVADERSTLAAWFDRRKLGHDAVDAAVLDAAKGYLRTCRSGGMPKDQSDLAIAVIEDMARLSVFADLYARALLPSVTPVEGL